MYLKRTKYVSVYNIQKIQNITINADYTTSLNII